MRLDAFLLADAVSAPPDGKFYIHGGGLTRFNVPTLPYVLPQVGLFVRLEVTEEEQRDEHSIRLTITDPDDVAIMPPAEFSGRAAGIGALAEGEERYLVLALNLGGLSVGRGGIHHVELVVDGQTLHRMPLPIVPLTAEQLAEMQVQPVQPPDPPPNRAARREAQRRRQ